MSKAKVRYLRIGLYTVIFVVFILLFSTFSNVVVDGQEYFAPPQYAFGLLYFLLAIQVGMLAVVWRLHHPKKHHKHTHHSIKDIRKQLDKLR